MAHFEGIVKGNKKLIHTLALFCVFWAVEAFEVEN
jgi:hypothetical protein